MVVKAVVVLEVVEGVAFVVPGADEYARIQLTVDILETIKPWSNPVGDDPLKMMCCGDLRKCC